MKLVPETFETLQLQTDALANGTNPIVYFPVGTRRYPDCPINARVEHVEGEEDGAGIYYFNPLYVKSEEIYNAINSKTLWLLLGFVQSKEDAAKGLPALVVARAKNGREIKSAVVDSRNVRAITLQIMVFKRQFPGSDVKFEMPQPVLLERIFLRDEGRVQ